MKKLIFLAFAFTVVFPLARADAPPAVGVLPNDISFHCSFDDTLQPEKHDGDGEAETSVPPIFVPGKKGRALLTSNLRGVSYALEKNLRAQEGTVCLWVSPLNWNRGDENFHHFFTISGAASTDEKPNGAARNFSFLLYKFGEWPDVLAYGMSGELVNGTMLRVPMDDSWRENSWHHLAFIWNADGAALYVDGHVQTMRYAAPAPLVFGAKQFRLGGPYFVKNLSFTAIDELMIYKRALTTSEIQALIRIENAD